ncbi:hypothetical protein [Flavobacterium quisquiliarum]|uniref:Uncharacterized protein n=1 Tax=Flavobacterium quisquiliarum TaxID=1834436 RepID=A0ABV8W771_9FLAO|nr:hypothetical protein [Flavobacterium quisquiliarum]MBW1654143.1 hypothetical protein [Flavobacterium quisquiliarum]NWL00865.1 hypothetical protein [Flavobacterium collinsii]
MRKLQKYTFVILILSLKIYSQESSDSIPKNWKYFELKQNEKAIIIDHIPIQILCGITAFASVTIVKNTKGDIFRVLNLCSLKKFTPNEQVNISPEKAPPFNVNFPKKYLIDSKSGNEIIQENNYEKTILKTTWGSIEKTK